jgi:hypothetical protein
MRKFVFCFPVVILTLHGGLAFAQQASEIDPTYTPLPQWGTIAAPVQNSERYRWRPLKDEADADVNRYREDRFTDKPGSYDYTDEPFALPRGTYRRIEQRHTITPYHEGYRFRPIDPLEQLRNRNRNKRQERSERDRSVTRQRPNWRFRPDPRLDKDGGGAPSRYAFPMGSEAPMFRPR